MVRLIKHVLIALLLMGCGPVVHVSTAHDPAARHGAYTTFAMLDPNKPIHSENTDIDPFVMQRLRQIVYLNLRSRGLEPVSKEEAQLVVGVAATRDRRTIVYSSGPYAYDSLYGPPLWSHHHHVAEVDEGIVVIDLIDRAKSSVVWRGTGALPVDRGFSEGDLQEVVAAVLAEYPPGSPDEE